MKKQIRSIRGTRSIVNALAAPRRAGLLIGVREEAIAAGVIAGVNASRGSYLAHDARLRGRLLGIGLALPVRQRITPDPGAECTAGSASLVTRDRGLCITARVRRTRDSRLTYILPNRVDVGLVFLKC